MFFWQHKESSVLLLCSPGGLEEDLIAISPRWNKVNLLALPKSCPCTTWAPGVTLVLKTMDKSLHISLAVGRTHDVMSGSSAKCLVDKNHGDGTCGPLLWHPEKHNLFHVKLNSSTEPNLWSGSTAFDQTVGKITRPRIGIFIISVSHRINEHHSLPEYRHIYVQ